MLDAIVETRPQTRFILTNRPMLAFRAGLLVPSPAAVLSVKRMALQHSSGVVLKTLETYRPEQAFLHRHVYAGPVYQCLAAHYDRISSPMGRYYLSRVSEKGGGKERSRPD